MTEKTTIIPTASAPGRFRTAQRPGQSGEQNERRPGPSPLSRHQTGPHAPYEEQETEGAPAIKHDTRGLS
jgi:hypothetical protein